MGNNNSNRIRVIVDKNQYQTGEYVFGQVIIVNHDTGIRKVNLIIEGIEKTSTIIKIANIKRKEKLVFLYKDFLLYQLNVGDQHKPSQPLVFPFKFQLNDGLPGNFEFKKKSYFAYVRYKVKGVMEDLNGKQIQDICQLNVNEIHQQEQQIEKLYLLNGTLTSYLGIFYKGKAKIECKFHQRVYDMGECLLFYVKLDNENCEQYITNVNVTLVHNTYIRSQQNKTQIFSQILQTQQLYALKDFIDVRFYLNDLSHPSCNTHLITSNYMIKIKPIISDFEIFDHNVPIEIPFKIQNTKQTKSFQNITYYNQFEFPIQQLDVPGMNTTSCNAHTQLEREIMNI